MAGRKIKRSEIREFVNKINQMLKPYINAVDNLKSHFGQFNESTELTGKAWSKEKARIVSYDMLIESVIGMINEMQEMGSMVIEKVDNAFSNQQVDDDELDEDALLEELKEAESRINSYTAKANEYKSSIKDKDYSPSETTAIIKQMERFTSLINGAEEQKEKIKKKLEVFNQIDLFLTVQDVEDVNIRLDTFNLGFKVTASNVIGSLNALNNYTEIHNAEDYKAQNPMTDYILLKSEILKGERMTKENYEKIQAELASYSNLPEYDELTGYINGMSVKKTIYGKPIPGKIVIEENGTGSTGGNSKMPKFVPDDLKLYEDALAGKFITAEKKAEFDRAAAIGVMLSLTEAGIMMALPGGWIGLLGNIGMMGIDLALRDKISEAVSPEEDPLYMSKAADNCDSWLDFLDGAATVAKFGLADLYLAAAKKAGNAVEMPSSRLKNSTKNGIDFILNDSDGKNLAKTVEVLDSYKNSKKTAGADINLKKKNSGENFTEAKIADSIENSFKKGTSVRENAGLKNKDFNDKKLEAAIDKADNLSYNKPQGGNIDTGLNNKNFSGNKSGRDSISMPKDTLNVNKKLHSENAHLEEINKKTHSENVHPEGTSKKQPIEESNSVNPKNCIEGGEPVDLITGSLSEHNFDMQIKDFEGNFKIERNYKSINYKKGILGYGWTSSLEINVEEKKDYISVLVEDGHYENFVPKNSKQNNTDKENENIEYVNKKGKNNSYHLSKTADGWQLENFEKHLTYFFNKQGRFEKAENKSSQTLELSYNEKSEITEIKIFSGKKFKVEFNEGRLSSITDEIGRAVSYKYENDCLTEIIHPDGAPSKYKYNSDRLITEITDQNGHTHTKNTYDNHKRVIRQDFWDGSYMSCSYDDVKRENKIYFSANDRTEIYNYNLDNLAEKVTYWDGTTEEFRYDEAENKIYEKNRNGAETYRQFDEYGNLIEETAPNGLKTRFEYNKNNHLTRISDSEGLEVINEYDKNSNIISQKIKAGKELYREEKFEYDSLNRVISSTDALGNRTQYKYNNTDNQTNEKLINSPSEVITPSGYVYKYEYDKAERNTVIITDYGTTEFTYNALNYPVEIKDREGNVTYRRYDNMGNLIEEITPNLAKDGSGRSYKFVYDPWDEVIAAENPLGAVRKVIRDGERNILKEVSPKFLKEGLENNEDTDLNEVTGIKHIYNKDSRVIKNIYPDGGTERFFYDSEGNIIKHIEPESCDETEDDGQGYRYGYDNMNRLIEILNENGEKQHIFEYDLHGNLVKDTNIEGYTSIFKYNLLGQLTEQRIPVDTVQNLKDSIQNTKNAINSNAKSNLKKDIQILENETDEVLYQVKQFEYDLNGNKILERHGMEKVRETEECSSFNDIIFEYDAENRLIIVKDRLGARTEYQYDSLNNKVFESFKINDTTTRKIFYKYNGLGQVVERTEELIEGFVVPSVGVKTMLATTKYEYDADGNLIKIVQPEGLEILRKYDVAGRCIQQTEQAPLLQNKNLQAVNKNDKMSVYRKTEYVYDLSDNVIEVRKATGKINPTKEKIQKYIYDDKDRIVKLVDVNKGIIRIFYDKNDRMIKTVLPEEYKKYQDEGRGTVYSYNLRNQITEITDALGNRQVKNSYDKFGNLKSETDALGNRTEFNYTVSGRIKEVITPNSRLQNKTAQKFSYDARGNITGIIDGNGNSTEYVLDSWGRISEIHAADGGIEKYSYDYAGNITSTTDANGGTITYTYNQFNQTVEIKDQTGKSEYFAYDSMGNLTAHKNRNGIITERIYNAEGNLLKLYAYKEGSKKSLRRRYRYDEEGRLRVAEAPEIIYNYKYTEDGKLKEKSSKGKILLNYTYDLDGRIKSLQDMSGKSTVYSYDALGRIDTITDENQKQLAQYKYLKNSAIEKVLFGNGVETSYRYDAEGNVINLITKTKTEEILADYNYTYDLNGNRLSKTGNRYNTSYQYDSMNRLISADYGSSKEEFTYDKVGNRLTRRTGNVTEVYQYNIKNQLLRIDTSNVNMPVKSCTDLFDELGSKKKNDKFPKIFEYDLQGNMTAEKTPDGINTFEYDELNHPIMAKMHNGDTLRSIWDAEDLRSSILENGKRANFVFNHNSEIVTEYNKSGILSHFDRGYDIIAANLRNKEIEQDNSINLKQNSLKTEKYYYQVDEQRSTGFITNQSGKIFNQYKYDAFGNEEENTENLYNRIKYTGQYWDDITSQYYLRARFYTPILGKFIQEDRYRGDGLGLYAYCKNNPIGYYDPSGYALIKEEVPYLFSYDNYYVSNNGKSKSGRLAYNILKKMGVEENLLTTDLRTGSHQAQHIIPQQWINKHKNGALLLSGFQLDNCYNGIFAIDSTRITGLLSPDNVDLYNRYLNNALTQSDLNQMSLYQNVLQNLQSSATDNYVTNTTHHGLYWNPFDHQAYSQFVGQKLNEICDTYNIPHEIRNEAALSEAMNALTTNGKMKDLRKDVYNLVTGLRELHKEGIDLYLQHPNNTGNTDWFNNLNDYDSSRLGEYTQEERRDLKNRAQEIYNAEMNERLNSKIRTFTQCSKGDTFRNV